MHKNKDYKRKNLGRNTTKDKVLCGRKVEIVSNQEIINFINSKIHTYFKCSQYDHIENDHLTLLTKTPYYISTKTNGKQYFLFMTKYLRTKYCFLISENGIQLFIILNLVWK